MSKHIPIPAASGGTIPTRATTREKLGLKMPKSFKKVKGATPSGDGSKWSKPFFPLLYTLQASISKPMAITNGCEIVLGIFFWAGLRIFFGFLGWYHLPSVCNGLELEFVILHGICHIWACSPSILHGIYYMWACSPSILYGICHILACSPSILHGMFYMWACSPKHLQMRKLGIR